MAVVVRAKAVVTCAAGAVQNGITFEALGLIEDGAILIENETVSAVGPRVRLERELSGRSDIDVHDFPSETIVPGFVDAHAHPLFAGDREPDFAARLRGEKPPLGMLHTVRETRNALDRPERFWDVVRARLRLMAEHGTTTLEAKTGYALHAPGERQLLEMIRSHADEPGLPQMVATFLGAHALAPEFRNEVDFVDYLIDQCLPVAKSHGAKYADAFCEPGFFSPEQTRRYLEAARENGLRLRVHCDEMSFGGAAEMAAALDVDAVDHCNYIREEDVRAIASRKIVTVACPATIAYLDLPQRAPVRRLLEEGADVALASDYNPGTSPCFNLQTVAYYGRKFFGLSASEALYGVTRAAARSLRTRAGTIEPGIRADLVVLQIESPAEFGWQFGGNLATAVYRKGRRAA